MTAPRDRARGAALILAMLIAALAATVAVTLAAGQQQWLAGVAQRSEQVQAQALAQAGVQWARQIMFEDARLGPVDHLGEPWALPLPATPIENGSIQGRIVDAQGLLNLNDLGTDTAVGAIERARFARLFARLGVPAAMLDVIADWVDVDGVARPNGAEDAWYRAQPSASLAPNAPIVRVAELAALRNFTPQAADARVQEDHLVSAKKIWSGQYSDNLLEVIDWCLRLDPLERPQSVFALQRAIRDIAPTKRKLTFFGNLKRVLLTEIGA